MAFPALGSLQALAAGGLGGVVVALSLGWSPIYARGYDAAAKKADLVIRAKDKDIERKQLEKDAKEASLSQCQSANGNYHAAVNEQLKVIQAELTANLKRQGDAEAKNAVADRKMLDAATKSAENARAAREAILNAVDQFVGVLNSIIPKPAP